MAKRAKRTWRWVSRDDMEALRRCVGGKALEKAFGPDGGGIQEVEYNCAVESIKQLLRKGRTK